MPCVYGTEGLKIQLEIFEDMVPAIQAKVSLFSQAAEQMCRSQGFPLIRQSTLKSHSFSMAHCIAAAILQTNRSCPI